MSIHQEDSENDSNQPLAVPDGGRPFSIKQQVEFTRKELRETLRDRRTIVTLMAMPLLLYPLLGFGLRFMAFQQPTESSTEYLLAIKSESEAAWLSKALQLGNQVLDSSQSGPSDSTEQEPDLQLLLPNDPTQFDLEAMLMESAADVGVRIEFGEPDTSGNRSAVVELIENEGSSQSRDAADYIERRLAAANIELIKIWASQLGEQLPIPVQQSRQQVAAEGGGSAILGLLPLVLLLMTVTGGVYPAIDLTAGERERNTMETLMALPVPRFRLLAAKYVAVVTVTMLTGLMNLMAMSVTLYALQLDQSLLGGDGLTFGLAAKLFLALAAFALFYSAVLLLLTSSAKSFKEAQAYLIPLLLVSIAPSLVILMPGWSLAGGTAAIPLVNILLLTRELLEGTVERLPAMVAIISTVFYGAAALSLAARVFGNDAIAVGSRGGWQDLLRRPKEESLLPSLPSTLFTLALLFPLYFIVSGILSRVEAEPTARLATSAVMTIVLFVGVPFAILRWQRVSGKVGLGLTRTAWPYFVAAALFGLATWPWVFEIVIFAQSLGIRGFDPAQIENVESLLAAWKQVPLWVVVLCMGIAPGICEEAFFRGYLFNGLKQNLSAGPTIAISAIAFGLFHVVLSGGAAPERILPSTLMGILLGWIAWKSGSTIPSMVLHAIHNSTLLVVVQSRDLLAQWNIGQMEQEHLPIWSLAVATTVLVVGWASIRFLPRPSATEALAASG